MDNRSADKLGNQWEFRSTFQHYFANARRDRLLAAQGKLPAAKVAFEAAIAAAESHGTKLLAALAVRDLCNHVLHVSGYAAAGQTRLEQSVAALVCTVDVGQVCVAAGAGVSFGVFCWGQQ